VSWWQIFLFGSGCGQAGKIPLFRWILVDISIDLSISISYNIRSGIERMNVVVKKVFFYSL